MLKLIHTADVHLDSPLQSLALRDPELRERIQGASRNAFTLIVNQAIEQQVAAVLIAGDLFDGAARSAKTAAFLLAELSRLAQAHVQVFYIKGNHDAENPLTGETTLPENVHVFDGKGGCVQLQDKNVWIHGVSFKGRKAEESLLAKFSAPVSDAINIGMLHTSLNGSASHDVYAPCSVSELKSMGFDYWALGHIHKRQVHSEAPWIVMPGIPQGRDVGEVGAQSATLISIEEGKMSTCEFLTSSIEFNTLTLDVSELQDAASLRDFLSKALQEHAGTLQSENGVVRIRLKGQNQSRWQWLRDRDEWLETAGLLCRQTERLWMEKLIVEVDDTPRSVPDKSALGELATLMSTVRGENAFSEEAVALINEVMGALPADIRKSLLPAENSAQELATRLSQQGEDQLLAVMKGVGDKGADA